MSSVNKAIIIGNLGADPEVRTTPAGKFVATLSVATSDRYKDQERTEWHRVIVWEKQAELCQQYLRKGSKVYVEGKIQTRSWVDDQGQKRYATEIIASPFGVVFLDSGKQQTQQSGGYGGYGR